MYPTFPSEEYDPKVKGDNFVPTAHVHTAAVFIYVGYFKNHGK
jgi:hypothetical protein